MHWIMPSNSMKYHRQATMTRIPIRSLAILLTATGLTLAQNAPPDPGTPPTNAPATNNGGWRHVGDQQAPVQQQDSTMQSGSDAYGQPQQRTAGAPPAARPAYGLPAQVTMKPGTFVTIRINEGLASNKNHVGDAFSGTLAQPVVVDGVVVAQRGQTVYGRVAQAEKIKGVSHLGVELTGITLADGEQVSIHSQLVSRQGGMTPPGAQAGTIVGTTAAGTAVGAIAAGGTGAAAGAGIGAAAGIIGVLVTRNHPSVIYPETALTFQTQSPITIATAAAPGAFRFVGPEDYQRPANTQAAPRTVVRGPAYGYSPYAYDPYWYGYGWGPYYPYWGPSLYFGGYWGGGFRGGFHRFR